MMEPVLIYGVPSGCSLASIIALEWLGQPYRLSRIEMLDYPWPAAYARFNPRMKTPALVTGDQHALTESLAILQHIGHRGIAKGIGFEQGTRDFDRLAEMLSYLVTDFFSSFAPLWKLYETEGLSEQQQESIRIDAVEQVAKQFAIVETMLGENAWLLGGHAPTVADAYLFAVSRWADYHKVFNMQTTFPGVFRYLERLRKDPAVRFALAIEKGESPQSSTSFKGHIPVEEIAS
jgi:glutathione S-transferase